MHVVCTQTLLVRLAPAAVQVTDPPGRLSPGADANRGPTPGSGPRHREGVQGFHGNRPSARPRVDQRAGPAEGGAAAAGGDQAARDPPGLVVQPAGAAAADDGSPAARGVAAGHATAAAKAAARHRRADRKSLELSLPVPVRFSFLQFLPVMLFLCRHIQCSCILSGVFDVAALFSIYRRHGRNCCLRHIANVGPVFRRTSLCVPEMLVEDCWEGLFFFLSERHPH